MRIVRQDVDEIEAVVKCTEDYRVKIRLEPGALDADCECPYFREHGPCKHVWAAIMALEKGGEALADQPDATESAPAEPSALGTVIYILDVERASTRGTAAVELWSYVGESWEPLRLHRDRLHELTEPHDRRLLGALFGLELEEGGDPDLPRRALVECSAFALRPGEIVTLVRLLCQTGRFFVRDRSGRGATPVAWGGGAPDAVELAPVRFHFRPEGADSWELSAELTFRDATIPLPEALLVLPGLLFVRGGSESGEEESEGAPIAIPFEESDWAERVRRGDTTFSLEERDPAIRTMLEREPPLDLECPEPWEDLGRRAPKPVLSIRGGRGALQGESASCVLQFDYDGYRVKAGGQASRVCDLSRYRVWTRDRAAEGTAYDRLLDLGGRADEETSRLTVPMAQLQPAIAELRDADWAIELREQPYRGVGEMKLQVTSGIDWFEVRGHLDIDGNTVPLEELITAAREGRVTLDLEDGSTGTIPQEWLRRLRILEATSRSNDDELRFERTQGWLLDALLAESAEWDSTDAQLAARAELNAFDGIQPRDEPGTFDGELRPYQRDALGWFEFLKRFRFGGCLADDMGLGKTVQVLAQLDAERDENSGPSIVIAPRSVVYNWVAEARRFVPHLRTVEYTGPERHAVLDELDNVDLLVTSYGLLRRDVLQLREKSFHYVVLDEAQAIKNASSQTSKCARLLKADHRLALSGTPIENHLGELWSLFEFLNPGMFGGSRTFQRLFASNEGDGSILASAIRPLLLRRRKEQVAPDLPEKSETTLYCEMKEEQSTLYQQLVGHYRSELLQRVDRDGLSSARMHILEGLLRLRQAACHPQLIQGVPEGSESCKVELLLPQLEEVVEEGHKVLVFSQFTSFLAIVRQRLEEAGLTYEYLDGATRNRRSRVDRFQNDPACPIFLISLKAGGLGLNLTAADYVYILDPWWNPAVEAQAIDRTHRIGQTRRVFAYRLITRGTVEEKILDLQSKKRDLADSILRADQQVLSQLTRDDLEFLLQ